MKESTIHAVADLVVAGGTVVSPGRRRRRDRADQFLIGRKAALAEERAGDPVQWALPLSRSASGTQAPYRFGRHHEPLTASPRAPSAWIHFAQSLYLAVLPEPASLATVRTGHLPPRATCPRTDPRSSPPGRRRLAKLKASATPALSTRALQKRASVRTHSCHGLVR